MRDSELRGLILEALYNQRRKDLVNLDQEVGGPPLPHGATESILRQLVKKRLTNRTSSPTAKWTGKCSNNCPWD
jgi:hypothetical protein